MRVRVTGCTTSSGSYARPERPYAHIREGEGDQRPPCRASRLARPQAYALIHQPPPLARTLGQGRQRERQKEAEAPATPCPHLSSTYHTLGKLAFAFGVGRQEPPIYCKVKVRAPSAAALNAPIQSREKRVRTAMRLDAGGGRRG
ncbi:hypothetical protein C2E23DRAFT_809220 [Lenzites betulinus]|nr:hypothetical protein C2E23DRAFT_809220 [Lenzites betulinus]